MRLISDFDRLDIIIRRYLTGKPFSEDTRTILDKFIASENYKSLPKNAKEAEDNQKIGLYLLRKAADTLFALTQNNSVGNLEGLIKTVNEAKDISELTLVADPFEGRYYQLLAHIAKQANDTASAEIFEFRFENYQKLYRLEKALMGSITEFNPEIGETLAELLEPNPDGRDLSEPTYEQEVTSMFIPKSLYESPLLPAARDDITHQVTFKVFDNTKTALSHKFTAKLLDAQNFDTSFGLHFSLSPSEEAYDYLQDITERMWSVRLIIEDKQVYVFSVEDVLEKVCIGEEVQLELSKPKEWLTLEGGINPYDVWEKLNTIVISPSK